jgi:hypothetical protein
MDAKLSNGTLERRGEQRMKFRVQALACVATNGSLKAGLSTSGFKPPGISSLTAL